MNKWMEIRRGDVEATPPKWPKRRGETRSLLFGIGDERLIDEVAEDLGDALIPPF